MPNTMPIHLKQGEGYSGYNFIQPPAVNTSIPVGSILPYDGLSAPAGYLICDGTTYYIADYPDLADHYERQHGSKNFYGGDGTTTFKVPDLRGEFIRGAGNNSHTNQGDGANVGVHQDATAIPNFLSVGSSPYRIDVYGRTGTNYAIQNADSSQGTGNLGFAITSSNSWSAGDVPLISVRPTNTSVTYIVKALNVSSDIALVTEYFNSADDDSTTDKTSAGMETVATLESGEPHGTIFAKISKMFLNIRKLWNTVGETAIPSSLGQTVTGATKKIYDSYQPARDYSVTKNSYDFNVTIPAKTPSAVLVYTAQSNCYITAEINVPTGCWGACYVNNQLVRWYSYQGGQFNEISSIYLPKGAEFRVNTSSSSSGSPTISGYAYPALILE